nr:Chain C, Clientized spike tail peptide [Severe acute respiratory syndrome coronavirus 2]8ENW_D Chain D, Clientized spike tail peptide [Severe acute respiratory syndrome coronavirus 2]8ENX_C Chain C, Clientized spike tail heptapeptide [Severe acute respiratory syndrome coronavirus 2]
GVKLHYE